MTLEDAIQKCDSWSEVDDNGPRYKDGRYSVTIFFDSHESADDFRECIAMTVNGFPVVE